MLHFSLFSPRIFFDPCENCSSAPPMRSEPHPGCVWCKVYRVFARVAGLAAAAHTCHAMGMIKLKTAFRHCTIGLRGSAYSGGLLAPSGARLDSLWVVGGKRVVFGWLQLFCGIVLNNVSGTDNNTVKRFKNISLPPLAAPLATHLFSFCVSPLQHIPSPCAAPPNPCTRVTQRPPLVPLVPPVTERTRRHAIQ